MTALLQLALAHPYITFALLLGLLILYSKFIFPKEWKR
jgi:hypothetical protein